MAFLLKAFARETLSFAAGQCVSYQEVFEAGADLMGSYRCALTIAAPKLTLTGRLDPAKATESELRGEQIFFGKGQCASCHPAPSYLDQQMHDLHLERFLKEPGDGPMKSFTLRGIKDSPPYFHDGRLLTLEDTVELFNLVLGTKLTETEKTDLVAFMRQL